MRKGKTDAELTTISPDSDKVSVGNGSTLPCCLELLYIRQFCSIMADVPSKEETLQQLSCTMQKELIYYRRRIIPILERQDI